MGDSRDDKERAAAREMDQPRGESLDSPPWQPHCLYLYYLVPVDDHHASVQGFIVDNGDTPITEQQIDQKIQDTVRDIKNNTLSSDGDSFDAFPWERKSYLAIVVDSAAWTLATNDVRILLKREGTNTGAPSGHTFKRKRQIPSFGKVTGVRFLNYIEKEDATDWDIHSQEWETFEIEMKFRGRGEFAGMGPRSHEDSGTNLGPPVPPP